MRTSALFSTLQNFPHAREAPSNAEIKRVQLKFSSSPHLSNRVKLIGYLLEILTLAGSMPLAFRKRMTAWPNFASWSNSA